MITGYLIFTYFYCHITHTHAHTHAHTHTHKHTYNLLVKSSSVFTIYYSVFYTSNLYHFTYSIHNYHSCTLTIIQHYYLLPTYLHAHTHTHKMDNGNILDNGDDHEFTVPDTQESLATFSRKIIKKLGICGSSIGTDAISMITQLAMSFPLVCSK